MSTIQATFNFETVKPPTVKIWKGMEYEVKVGVTAIEISGYWQCALLEDKLYTKANELKTGGVESTADRITGIIQELNTQHGNTPSHIFNEKALYRPVKEIDEKDSSQPSSSHSQNISKKKPIKPQKQQTEEEKQKIRVAKEYYEIFKKLNDLKSTPEFIKVTTDPDFRFCSICSRKFSKIRTLNMHLRKHQKKDEISARKVSEASSSSSLDEHYSSSSEQSAQ